MSEPDEDRLDELLRSAARGYHEPPETPTEAMWEAIQRQRRWYRRPWARPRPLVWVAAAAAVLVLGVGIGRLSVRMENAPQVWEARTVSTAAYRLTAIEHLSQSEAFLTLFRASTRGGGDERLAAATARELLASNRLLLDSPAASDRKMRLLLEDLELVLAEIAQLSPEPGEKDLELIRDGIERGGVLPRIRNVVPAGTSSTQGAL